jgi:tRNA splicing ligase
MESGQVYKSFSRDKTIEELLYNTSLWTSEFDFIHIELAFIKRLIRAYPFSSTIPNLYERLQLFILELDNFEKEKNNIAEKINNYHLTLNENPEINTLESGHFYPLEYEKLAEEVFMYLIHYKKLKIQIFEYINGLIN